MLYSANILVRFKSSVLEPQGKAIMLSLKENQYEGIESVRVGKLIEVSVEAKHENDARDKLQKITEDLLYNPVMETAEINILEAK